MTGCLKSSPNKPFHRCLKPFSMFYCYCTSMYISRSVCSSDEKRNVLVRCKMEAVPDVAMDAEEKHSPLRHAGRLSVVMFVYPHQITK